MQGHVDMVTEKNKEVQHDFFKDGIRLRREGDWLKVGTIVEKPLCTDCLLSKWVASHFSKAP